MGRRAAGIACFADSTGRLLLLRRSDKVKHPGIWSVPGGRLDRGETPLDAALREFCEEAGYRGRLEIDIRPVFRSGGFSCFVATSPRQFRPSLNWESDGGGWFGPDTLPAPIHSGVLHLLERLQQW